MWLRAVHSHECVALKKMHDLRLKGKTSAFSDTMLLLMLSATPVRAGLRQCGSIN